MNRSIGCCSGGSLGRGTSKRKCSWREVLKDDVVRVDELLEDKQMTVRESLIEDREALED
jgi:hypothetical protein